MQKFDFRHKKAARLPQNTIPSSDNDAFNMGDKASKHLIFFSSSSSTKQKWEIEAKGYEYNKWVGQN